MVHSSDKASLDMILEVFQEEHDADFIARFGEKGFHLWRDAPRRQRLLAPTVVGSVKGICGDTISIALGINGETIIETDFDVDGRAASQIAAATAAALVLGKSLDEAVAMSEQEIVAALGVFPEEERHCVSLAAAAVRDAVHRWMIQGGRFKQELEADIRARFGERGFQIWIEAAQRPELVAPDAVGTLTGACGDTISIALRLKGERVIGTDFDTDGCASSLIAAAAAASLAMGKSLDEAVDIDEQAVIEAVGVFPDDDRHCAYLATAALREAIHQWMVQYTTPDEQVENSIQAANKGNAQQEAGNEQRSKI